MKSYSARTFGVFGARAPDRRFPRWTNRPSFIKELDALQRQHQAKREADFEQVLLAIRCFGVLARDVLPRGAN